MKEEELVKAFELYLNIDEEYTNPLHATCDSDGFIDFFFDEKHCLSLNITDLVEKINEVILSKKDVIKKPIKLVQNCSLLSTATELKE